MLHAPLIQSDRGAASSAPISMAALPAPSPARLLEPLSSNVLTRWSFPARQKVSSFAHALLRWYLYTPFSSDTKNQRLSSASLDQTIHLRLQGSSNHAILWNDVATITVQAQARFSIATRLRSTRQDLAHFRVLTSDRSVHIQLICTLQWRASESGHTLTRRCDVTFIVLVLLRLVISNIQGNAFTAAVSTLNFTWPDPLYLLIPQILSQRFSETTDSTL